MHEAGLVHRDLKPDNIMRLRAEGAGPRRIKVLDFGIVKIVDEKVRKRVGGVVPTAQGRSSGRRRSRRPSTSCRERSMSGPTSTRSGASSSICSPGVLRFSVSTSRICSARTRLRCRSRRAGCDRMCRRP
ncbi:MAG: hypothetical protein HOW73_18305 [Polyangiaceae bacterium]|nr:hypothetical protein [Polyangiaceae bacterium]